MYFLLNLIYVGAALLVEEHKLLPREEQYVRCAETHAISSGGKTKMFQLVICMTNAMSLCLLRSKRLSIDTSFKRLHGWEEFEIETWDVDGMRCKSCVLPIIFLLTRTLYSCCWSSSIYHVANSGSTCNPLPPHF